MADEIKIVEYYYSQVGDKPGEGRRLLSHISEKGVNLTAFTAFPANEGLTRLYFIAERTEKLKEAAADAGVELIGPENAFLIQGEDRIGALHKHHLTLSNAGVNVFASSCVGDGTGRFGFVLWVNPNEFNKAAWAFDFV